MNIKQYFFIVFLWLSANVAAQPIDGTSSFVVEMPENFEQNNVEPKAILSLTDAITEGLENNYDIRIERNDAAISSNNATWGNAGMLPSLTLNGTATASVANSHMAYFAEMARPDQDRTGAKSRNMNTNVALDWTIFDGMAMFANLNRLKTLKAIGEENLRSSMQQTLASILNAYFDVVTQQKQLDALGNILRISRQRTRSANDMFTAGKVSKVDLLSAQVDYNADTSSYIQQTADLRDAKIRLNRLLARDILTDFEVEDSILIDQTLDYKTVNDKALAENPNVVLAKMSATEAAFSLKSIQGSRAPKIKLTSSYSLVNQHNGTGMAEIQQSNTLNYGVTLTMPLFNGLNINRQVKNAKLSKQSAELQFEDAQKEVESQVATAFNAYQVNRNLAEFEASNLSLAAENLDVSMERYKFGAISAVELRDVQRSYLSATDRLIVAIYNAKVAETALKLLTGEVIKLQ